ncbi:hypothetical protein OV208_06150 [Corallococcus sp. bb12-1]|uniref:hypothetical protein n=1 Tax=Corallococcus sp. bb12-1 TaxID=2996784 RepID=UPI00226DB415|nr:hypothetical protein [Corallococcus sp. bb12-1]MCY1040900.1 hypothetical protein [Corallococcus sp. bb12-1]
MSPQRESHLLPVSHFHPSLRALLYLGPLGPLGIALPAWAADPVAFGPLPPGATQTRSFRVPLRLLSLGLTYNVKATRVTGPPRTRTLSTTRTPAPASS